MLGRGGPRGAIDLRPPKTEPLLGLGGLFGLDPWLVVSVAALVALLVQAVLWRAFASRRLGGIR